MYRLSGEYECKIDAKGRLRLPAGLLRQLGEKGAHSFTLNRGFEQCIMLYPKNVWEAYTRALQKLNPFVTKNRQLLRAFYRGATPVVSDAADRILIPKNLIDHGKVKKEVVVNAYAGFIEIWDKQAYLAQVDASDSDDLATMAEDAFGGMPDLELEWND